MKKKLSKTQRLELACDRLNRVRDDIADLKRLIDQMDEFLLNTDEACGLLEDLEEAEQDYSDEVDRLVEEIEKETTTL